MKRFLVAYTYVSTDEIVVEAEDEAAAEAAVYAREGELAPDIDVSYVKELTTEERRHND